MNLNEVNQLIMQVQGMIKEKAKYISMETDIYKYILAEKELEHLKEYLLLLKKLQKKLNYMAKIDKKEYEKIEEIKETVDKYYR